jgi:hypothetical protein
MTAGAAIKYKKLGSSDLEVGAAAAARASQPQAIASVDQWCILNCAAQTIIEGLRK